MKYVYLVFESDFSNFHAFSTKRNVLKFANRLKPVRRIQSLKQLEDIDLRCFKVKVDSDKVCMHIGLYACKFN